MKEVGAHQVFEKIPKPLSWLQRRKRVYQGVVHQCQCLIILKVPIQSGQDYKGEFAFPNSLYYPFTLLLPFAHCKTFRTMFISKFRGVYFWLVYHVTPHMLHMTTLRIKFSGAFMDNEFV